ncbi:MAG: HD domain-containing protein [Sedimentisphaerales bacterium]|nr:HD domain-containing protein [Sedimentisphaerales bacterium]
MKQEQVEQFRSWFEEYTSRFYGDDEYVNIHIRLKQDHTKRTCEETGLLAGRLALDESQRHVAEVVALFHDIGRFPQFARYRTYKDVLSVDHCHLGVEVLTQEGILGCLRREERQWIETAVEHHGRKSLPSDLRGQALLFARLIRDADKLDIFRVVLTNYRAFHHEPAKYSFEVELPDEPVCSPAVVDAVMNGVLVGHENLRTMNDMKLCRLGWVYDLNFAASLERLQEQGFIDELLRLLPQTPQIAQVGKKIHSYLDAKLGRLPQPSM